MYANPGYFLYLSSSCNLYVSDERGMFDEHTPKYSMKHTFLIPENHVLKYLEKLCKLEQFFSKNVSTLSPILLKFHRLDYFHILIFCTLLCSLLKSAMKTEKSAKKQTLKSRSELLFKKKNKFFS